MATKEIGELESNATARIRTELARPLNVALRALNLVSEGVQLGAGKKLSKRRSSELFSYNVFLVIFGAARFSRSAVMESSPLCMHRASSRVGSRFLPFAKKRTRSAGSITEEKMSVWSDQEANSNRGRDHRRWTRGLEQAGGTALRSLSPTLHGQAPQSNSRAPQRLSDGGQAD
jgi:hypothetical protein